jgi:putative membrane protein
MIVAGCRYAPGIAAVVTALAASAAAAVPALAQDRSWDWGMGMHPMSWMWGAWGIGMMLMMLVFWGVVIAAIVLGVRWLLRSGDQLVGPGDRTRPDRALEILRERYARGEIGREEFEARRRDLG